MAFDGLDHVAEGESPVHARPKFDPPAAGGMDGLGGPADGQVAIASVQRAPSPWSTTMGIVILALLGVSVAANLVMVMLLMRR